MIQINKVYSLIPNTRYTLKKSSFIPSKMVIPIRIDKTIDSENYWVYYWCIEEGKERLTHLHAFVSMYEIWQNTAR